MNSVLYDSSHSFLSKCFASVDKNKDLAPKELVNAIEDHENQTYIIEDKIIVNLRNFNE